MAPRPPDVPPQTPVVAAHDAANHGTLPARGEGVPPLRPAGVSPASESPSPTTNAPASSDRRLDLSWTGANLGAVLFLCLLAAVALAIHAAAGHFDLGDRPAVDAPRVQAVAERVNPNSASPASLRRLPRIGPEHLRGILEYRQAHGPESFRDANDLTHIRGIGPLTLQAFRDYLEFPAGR